MLRPNLERKMWFKFLFVYLGDGKVRDRERKREDKRGRALFVAHELLFSRDSDLLTSVLL